MSTPESGTQLSTRWKMQVPGIRNAILPPTTTRPNPLITGDRVFASLFAPGHVCALERRTGRTLWIRELDAYASSSVFAHGQVLYATSCRTLYSLNSRNGNVNWTFSPKSGEGEWIYSQPVVSKGRIFIGDRCGNLNCLDAGTGKRIWRRQLSRSCNNQVNSTAVAVGDTVIAANNEGAVVCLGMETGQTLWRQRIDGGCINELLRFRDRVVVSGVSLYQLDSQTGALSLKLSYPGKIVSSISVVGSRIAAILGTDFHSQPAAWEKPSAFNGDLVIVERGRETLRRSLSGTPHLRADDKTGLLYAADRIKMSVIDPSNGSVLMSHRGELALPSYSDGVLYGLTSKGLLFAEPLEIAKGNE